MASSRPADRLQGVRAVIFDMDGTLTDSPLHFDRLRDELGMPAGASILDSIGQMPTAKANRARAALESHERDAALRCTLVDGADGVVAELQQRGLKVALLTSNSTFAARTVMERFGLSFDVWLSREHARPKPSPAPVLQIARRLHIEPRQTLMVGDYVFDMQAGRSAGALTAWVVSGRLAEAPAEADVVIHELDELLDMLPERISP